MSGVPAIAVVDIGKTTGKIVTVDHSGTVRRRLTRANSSIDASPYLHVEVDALFQWIVEALREVAADGPVEAVVATAHGAAAALMEDDGLALPVMDYEAVPPDEICRAYDRIAPDFAETLSPRLPAGLNLGRQIFWQETAFPGEFRRARAILPYPQYWAWRLCGVAASEVSALGCHTDLWNPREGRFSSLAASRGWAGLFAPLQEAWRPLGPLRPELARQTGIPPGCPVLCGIHDSNAALLRCAAGTGTGATVVSTGTWFICFRPDGDLDRLDPARDTLANVTPDGRPIACARFMGGRECEVIAAGGNPIETREDDLARVLAAGAMALPSFVDLGGPFPGRAGRLIAAEGLGARERAALSLLYAALVTNFCLDLLDAPPDVAVLGPFVRSELYPGILAALRPGRRVAIDTAADGIAIGAAWLAVRGEETRGFGPPMRQARPLQLDGLAGHAQLWRKRIADA